MVFGTDFFVEPERMTVESLRRRREEIEEHEAREEIKALRRSHIREFEEENLAFLKDPGPNHGAKDTKPEWKIWPVKPGSLFWTDGIHIIEPRRIGDEITWELVQKRKPFERCDLSGPGWSQVERQISIASEHVYLRGATVIKLVSFRGSYLAGREDARASLRSIAQAAKELGVTRQRIHQILRERKDGYVPIKVGGTTLVEAEWIESLKPVK